MIMKYMIMKKMTSSDQRKSPRFPLRIMLLRPFRFSAEYRR
jgi:hypothetical protein